MPKLTLLDPTKTGRQAEDLENQLRHLVVGQDEAIHQIVRVYQTHVAGLSPAGRPAERELSIPGAHGLRKNSRRGGDSRMSAEESSSHN